MSPKSETVMCRICGNCVYVGRRLNSGEIQKSRRKAHLKQQYFPYLVYLGRDVKVLCRREKVKVRLLDEACSFWKPQNGKRAREEERQKSSEEMDFKACPYFSGLFKKSYLT